jgi:hypothetical protein
MHSKPLLSLALSLSEFACRHAGLCGLQIFRTAARQLEVLISFHPAQFDAVTIEVQQPEIVAALACTTPVESVLTGCQIPFRSLCIVLRDTFSILEADDNGSGVRALASYKQSLAGNLYALAVAWSPDGRSIAVRKIDPSPDGKSAGVYLVDAATGQGMAALGPRWRLINDFQWLPDSSGLLLAAQDQTGSTRGCPTAAELRSLTFVLGYPICGRLQSSKKLQMSS